MERAAIDGIVARYAPGSKTWQQVRADERPRAKAEPQARGPRRGAPDRIDALRSCRQGWGERGDPAPLAAPADFLRRLLPGPPRTCGVCRRPDSGGDRPGRRYAA